MMLKATHPQWTRAIRKYRRLQAKLSVVRNPAAVRRLRHRLLRLWKRILRLNRQLKLGIATTALVALLKTPAKGQTFPATFDLQQLIGSNGFVIKGEQDESFTGRSVASAGDINGDGFDDIVLGAPFYDRNGQENVGAVYVVFGEASSFNLGLELDNLTEESGFRIIGLEAYSTLGIVGEAGDVNGDGVDDLIIGAPSDEDGPGEAYVIFGNTNGFGSSVDLNALNGDNGFRVPGIREQGRAGFVDGIGDVNGDGIDDIGIGAPSYDYTASDRRGEAYVIFGQTAPFPEEFDLAQLDGENGFRIPGLENEAYTGLSLSDAGDINGDGVDDFIVGAPLGNPDELANPGGQTYVIFGRSTGFGASFDLAELDGQNGFTVPGIIPGGYAGISVSGAGDINGDGFDDLIIGSYYTYVEGVGYAAGESYVLFGQASDYESVFDLSTLNGQNGFRIPGLQVESFTGFDVSGAGDINGDGLDDVIIGAFAYQRNPEEFYTGECFLLFGRSTGFQESFDLSSLDGTNGFRIPAVVKGGELGFSVSAAGDVNGDGGDDIIIGAPGSGLYNSREPGEAYVIFGNPATTSIDGPAASFPLTVSPNPVSGELTLSSNALRDARSVRVQLWDTWGRAYTVTPEYQGGGQIHVDMEAWPSGVYFLRLRADGEVVTRKIIKK